MIMIVVVQRGGERMSAEEERVRPLSGKPRCRLRKPEQDPDRGTEIIERTLLPKRRAHLARPTTRTQTQGHRNRSGRRGGCWSSNLTNKNSYVHVINFLRKISKIGATRCQILRLKCSKFDLHCGSAPDTAGGALPQPS